MQLGDHLGVAGLALAFFGIGVAVLFPTKRWIGWLAMACGVGVLGVWVVLYLETRGVATESTAHVPTVVSPDGPLRLDSVVSQGSADVGNSLGLALNLTNVSGNAIKARGANLTYVGPVPVDGTARAAFEALHWSDFEAQRDRLYTSQEIPTGYHGEFNLKRYTKPLTPLQVAGLRDGRFAVLVMQVIDEQGTGKRLLEACIYVRGDASLGYCHTNNHP